MRTDSLILCMLLAVSFLAGFCPPRAKCVNWQRVTQITGSGSQDTGEFHIGGSEWRIVWSYTPNYGNPELTAFSFFVYPHGETNAYIDDVIQYGSSTTSGVLYIHQGPKLYYLKILANTPSYTITVEYDADSEVSTSLLIAIIAAVIAIPVVIIIIIIHFARKKYKKQKPPTSPTLLPPPPPPPLSP